MRFCKSLLVYCFVLAFGLYGSTPVCAQTGAFGGYGSGGYQSSGFGKRKTGLAAFRSEQQNSGVWGRQNDEEQIKPTPRLADLMHPDVLRIVMEADKVACYAVKSKLPGEDGPSMISYRHRGNCGLVEDDVLKEFKQKVLADKDSVDFDNPKPVCVDDPQFVFRFVRGADFVHVVIPSSRCPVVDFIYGDAPVLSLNLLPIRDWVGGYADKLEKNNVSIETFEGARKGLLPLGQGQQTDVADAQADKDDAVEDSNEKEDAGSKPASRVRRSWAAGGDSKDDSAAETPAATKKPAHKGWGKKPWGR